MRGRGITPEEVNTTFPNLVKTRLVLSDAFEKHTENKPPKADQKYVCANALCQLLAIERSQSNTIYRFERCYSFFVEIHALKVKD